MIRALGSALMWLGSVMLNAGDAIYWKGKRLRRVSRKDGNA